ncbi:DNJB8 protein, partial [Urocolius indicus]|nr:DNJB8 protein [Urocolius indicus]
MVDYYKVLGLQRSASPDDIKKAFHKLALQWHPDKNPSNKEEAEKNFKAIIEAYKVLSNPQKRLVYDNSFNESRSHRPNSATGRHDVFGFPCVFCDFKNTFKVFEGEDPFEPFVNFGSTGENFMNSFRPQYSSTPNKQPTSSAEDTAEFHSITSLIITTKVINGKKISTRKIIRNGKETIFVEENGQQKSVRINGVEHMKW